MWQNLCCRALAHAGIVVGSAALLHCDVSKKYDPPVSIISPLTWLSPFPVCFTFDIGRGVADTSKAHARCNLGNVRGRYRNDF